MAVYIQSSVSHSACGNSLVGPLSFKNRPNATLTIRDQENLPFYAMQGLAINASEQRVFSSLSDLTKQLINESGLTQNELKNTGLMLGSTSLDIGTIQPKEDQGIWLPTIDRLSKYLQQSLGLSHCHMVFNTACTASINALLYATKLLEMSDFKHMIVIGCEFYNHLTVDGFHSLDLISQSQMRPFEQQRDGLILGEGIGALLLSKVQPKQAHAYQVLGGYCACDTSSLTMTAEDGSHISQVLNLAIKNANLSATDIDLIKVHGTATYNNDISEYHGLKQFFARIPPIFALKPYIGHTLGACGALEIALMDELLQQKLPAPKHAIEESMLPYALDTAPLHTFQNILINHCGFGGNNAALVLRTVQG